MALWASLALVVSVAGGAAAARAALPSLVRWALTRAVEQATGMRAQVGQVRLSLRRGEATIGELRVTHPRSGVPVAGWDGLRLRLRYAPLLRATLQIQDVALDRPFLALARGDRPEQDAIPLSAFAAGRTGGRPALIVDLGRLQVTQGGVAVFDAVGAGRTVRVEDLTVQVSDLATGPGGAGRRTAVAVSARWQGGRFEVDGWVKPFARPPEADLALRVADLDLSLVDALLFAARGAGVGVAGRDARPGVVALPFSIRGGRMNVSARLTAGAAGGSATATLEVAQPTVELPEGRGRVAARALRATLGGFDLETFTLREARLESQAVEGDLGGLTGVAGRVASLTAAAATLDLAHRSASAVRVELAGLAVSRGGGGPALEGAKIRAGAEAIEFQARSGREASVEVEGLALRGIGPQAIAVDVGSVRGAVHGVAPGAQALQGVSFSIEGAAATGAGGPLGSLEALRASASVLDLAGRSATGFRVETSQLAVAGLGPQAVSARIQALRVAAESADLPGRALRKASLTLDWLAAARAGEAGPFAVIRAARAEVPRADLAGLLSPAPTATAPVAVEMAQLEVDAPVLRLRRDAAGLDLARILAASSGGAGGTLAPGKTPSISPGAVAVGFAQIREGALTFTDATVSPEASLAVREVTVNLLNVRPGGETPATLVISAKVGEAGSFQLGAQFTPGTLRKANGTARLEDIEVDLARPYLALPAPFAAITGRLTASAEARPIDGGAAPAPAPGPATPAWKIAARLQARDLAGRDAGGTKLVEAPSLDLREIEVTVPDLALAVGEVAVAGFRLPVERDAGGVVRIAGMPLAALRARAAALGGAPAGAAPLSPLAALPPLRVRHVLVSGTVPLVDRARPYPLETGITEIALDLTDVGTTGDRAMGLRLQGRLEEMTFAAAGATRFAPLQGSAYLDLHSLDVVRWADYLPDPIRGRLADLRGDARLEAAFGPSLADLVVRGRVEASSLQLADEEGNGLLGVERAGIAIERLTLAPLRLHVGTLALQRPWVRLERRADGHINLLSLLPARPPALVAAPGEPVAKGGAAPAPGAGGTAADLMPVTLDRVELAEGVFMLRDRAIAPPFGERLRGVAGTIQGISPDGATRATFRLAGRLSDEAEVLLEGSALPRLDRPEVELRLRVEHFNLSGLSTYARRLTSHRLQRGKIHLEARYRLEGRALEGHNRIRVEQLEVGEAEEWPDKFTERVGVSLPFAVSLLQNADGVIELEIPVRGDVARPEFDFGDAIRTAIQNAVVATITAPLRWIGKVFEAAGRIGEIEIAPILFEPGSEALVEAGRQAVAGLVTFLKEAPRARLQIVGYAEPEGDGPALQERRARAGGVGGFVRRLAQRLRPGGRSPAPPRADLDALARRRSRAVYEALLRAEVDPGRLFLGQAVVEEAKLAAERGKPPQGRVEFQFIH